MAEIGLAASVIAVIQITTAVTMKNGILSILVPRLEKAKSRKIDIS